MKLSENFTEEEFTYSETAIKYKVNNAPSLIHQGTLKHTCQYLFEPLRIALNVKYDGKVIYGKTVNKVIINITSGYRSFELNNLLKKLGLHPSEKSQHCTGEAGDIEAVLIFTDGTRRVMDYKTLFNDIKDFVKIGVISVDQCIQEKDGNARWVHLSYSILGREKNRNQFFELNY